MEMEME
jgi:hypothetical protein